MTKTVLEGRLQASLAHLVGQLGLGTWRDEHGHCIDQNVALAEARNLLVEMETPEALYRPARR